MSPQLTAGTSAVLRHLWIGGLIVLAGTFGLVLVIRSHGGDAYPVSAIASGLVLCVCSLGAAVRADFKFWSGPNATLNATSIGLALLGLGMAGAGLVRLDGAQIFPTIPEWLGAALIVPLAAVGTRAVPAVGIVDRRATLLYLIDGTVLTTVSVYLIWCIALRGAPLLNQPGAMVMLTLWLVNIGFGAVRFLQAPSWALGMVLGGGLLMVAGHTGTIHASIYASDNPQALLLPIAVALQVCGVERLDDILNLSIEVSPRAELRRAVVVVALGLFTPAVSYVVINLLRGPVRPGIGTLLSFGMMIGLLTREMVRSGQIVHLIARMNTQSHQHELTGLGNRRALLSDLDLLQAQHHDSDLYLIDIDRFKDLSGRRGARAGDEILRTLAASLKEFAHNANGEAYHLVGNEFVVVLPQDEETTALQMDRLASTVREVTERLDATDFAALLAFVGVGRTSRGLAVPRQRGSAISETTFASGLTALENAQHALSVARQTGVHGVIYSEELADQERRRALVERRLRNALTEGGIEAHFQPIIEMPTGKVVGLEALARWTDAELGFISPGEFIPIAEEAGLIEELGLVMLDEAVAMAGHLDDLGKRIYVSVNVSPRQLLDPGFLPRLTQALGQHRVDPSMVVLEVTEGIFVDHTGPAATALQLVARTGVRIALDDFGSGYSSFGYLSRLPVHVVKIDRTLTSQVSQARPRAVISGMLDMCREMGMSVVLEGVETQQESDQLVDLGATQGQGWLWSAALPVAKLEQLIAERGAHPVEQIDERSEPTLDLRG